jgi:FkbM family methyltransferase
MIKQLLANKQKAIHNRPRIIPYLKSRTVSIAARFTGNALGQAGVARLVSWLQLLQGVGSGCTIASSGEKDVLRILAKRSRGRSATILDVGANQGQFLQEIVRQFGESHYSVHCFEPGTGAFHSLSEAFHSKAHITLNNKAVSSTCGTATLWFDEQGSAGASFCKRDLSHIDRAFCSEESVATTTIDAYCQASGIDFVDLLKIDVEGHELDVLNGANQVFKSRRIGMVLFEFGGCNIDSRRFFRDFWKFFNEVDMRLGRLTPSGYVAPVQHYSEALEQFRTTNFIATRRIDEIY